MKVLFELLRNRRPKPPGWAKFMDSSICFKEDNNDKCFCGIIRIGTAKVLDLDSSRISLKQKYATSKNIDPLRWLRWRTPIPMNHLRQSSSIQFVCTFSSFVSDTLETHAFLRSFTIPIWKLKFVCSTKSTKSGQRFFMIITEWIDL